MNNISIIIADQDEEYLAPLELQLVDMVDEECTINVITSKQYFDDFFNMPQKAGILLINENLFNDNINKHDIENIFILTEDSNKEIFNGYKCIYKYTSIKNIFQLIGEKSEVFNSDFKRGRVENKLIVVYSPVGGSGKTFISAGMSAALKEYNKKILYINTESLQNFSKVLFDETTSAAKNFEKSLREKDFNLLSKLNENISNKYFEYLKPLGQTMSFVDISLDNYIYLIDKIKEAELYDYIIVDTSVDLDKDKCKLLNKADKLIIVGKQDKYSAVKMDTFLNNIDTSDRNKFIFICNMFEEDKENFLSNEFMNNKCLIDDKIHAIDNEDMLIKNIKYNDKMKQIIQKLI